MTSATDFGMGHRGLRRRLRQLPRAAARLRAHPLWLLDNARLLQPRRRERRRPFSLEELDRPLMTAREAVVAALGVAPEEFDAALEGVQWPAPAANDTVGTWDARTELLEVVTAVIRLTHPATQVETGVARGYTTAAALAAMHRNNHGHVYSLDLPPLVVNPAEFVGQVIPEHLRYRWTLTVGPSRLELPKLVARVAPIDVFLHDSDHTYETQFEEYRTAWPHLRPGGVLLSDDVGNRAFTDFAAGAGETPYLVRKEGRRTAVGVLRKSGQ
jgi:predicted O-methyltransferase YrrM